MCLCLRQLISKLYKKIPFPIQIQNFQILCYICFSLLYQDYKPIRTKERGEIQQHKIIII